MDKKPVETSSAPESTSKFNLLIAILCGLLILAHFVSSFLPKSRLWGINHLAYFPLWVRLAFTIPGLLILVPWVNSRVYKLLEQILSFFQRILPKREVLTASLLAVISMFFFWLLRTRTHFLGDGALVISLLEKGQLFVKGSEPLEILSHLYLYKFLRPFFTPSAEAIYTALSILAGGAFVILLFFLTKTISEDRSDRLFTFCIFLFAGTTELFLGYAEHYTLTYVSILTYLFFSIRYLQRKAKIYLPILFCALSMSLHFSAAYLLPSLLFLFTLKRKKGELAFSMRKALPYLFILIFLFALSVFYIWSLNPALSDIFVPVFQGRAYAPGYTLFSASHILDIINQHFLISPVGIILLLGLVMAFKDGIRFKNPNVAFLILVSIAQISYHFILDPKLGAGRDWDLLSVVGLGYTLLGVYLFMGLVKSKIYSLLVLILTVFLCTLPWLMINSNTTYAIHRYNNLLDLDVKKSLNGRWTLAFWYDLQNDSAVAKQTKIEIFKLFPEDSLSQTAESYRKQGNLAKAEELSMKAIAINPSFLKAQAELGAIYFQQGKMDKAIEKFQEVLRLEPFNFIVHRNLAYALLSQGRLEEGIKELRKAIKFGGTSKEVLTNLAQAYWKSGDIEKAIKEYKKSIKTDPKFLDAHFGLGQIYLQNQRLDEALTEFQEVLRLKPNYFPVYYYLGVTYANKGLKDKAVEQFELFLKHSTDENQNRNVRGWIQQLQSQKP